MKMAGCGVLMGVMVHLSKITLGRVSLGEIMFHERLPTRAPKGGCQKLPGAMYGCITLTIKWETRECEGLRYVLVDQKNKRGIISSRGEGREGGPSGLGLGTVSKLPPPSCPFFNL